MTDKTTGFMDAWLKMHQDDWWFAFECVMCPVAKQGVVLDVKMPKERHGLFADCPCCKRPMIFKATWKADENGYGSRGNAPTAVNLVRAAEAFERAECVAACLAIEDEQRSLGGPASSAAKACADAIARRSGS